MTSSEGHGHRRQVRSYVQREGRMTPAQRRALDTLLPGYGVPPGETPLDLDALFGRRAPRWLEIGFGNGECLIETARTHPDRDYLGIEVHRPGIGHLLLAIDKHEVSNIRIVPGDAAEVLEQQIANRALNGINIFFPDPWPKKRHHKRRLIQRPFLELLERKLAPGGLLHVATDWENYALQIGEVLSARSRLCPADAPPARPHTKFEKRGRRLGHEVWEFVFTRLPE
ncbi:tRNA (guanosine(46)-N7)-methyltransferase TrmB [soil metagenome]